MNISVCEEMDLLINKNTTFAVLGILTNSIILNSLFLNLFHKRDFAFEC